jgi:CRISPR-associated protein Csx17
LEKYAPTPLVAPWNKGSGFFQKNDPGLTPAEASTATRFAPLRIAIGAARAHLAAIENADQRIREIKSETKDKALSKAEREALKCSDEYKKRLAESERHFKTLKAGLIPDLRLAWRGPHREWMDAAMVLDSEGDATFPALLGTGGNDGRMDFTNNYFQRLNELFALEDSAGAPRESCALWFMEALFGGAARTTSSDFKVGQFAPGGAGGANASSGPFGESSLNRVDFVLMLEGAVLFTAALSRRWEADARGRAAAPFAVSGQSAGYASASTADEGARGEQWMPLWALPVGLAELKRLLAEGRAQLGARGAREPLDLARAVARLGTTRGIHAFQRFGYIERNGQSNLAVPLGRFVVPDHSSPALACLDDLQVWLPRLRHQARGQSASTRLVQAERRLANTLFAVAQHPDEPRRWQSVLLQLAEIEAIQITGSGHAAGPIPRLRPEWVLAADDGTAELRLGVAFALQAGKFDPRGVPQRDTEIRRHWLSLQQGRYATSGAGAQQRLVQRADRVLQGRDGVEDAIALVTRRLIEASECGVRSLPLDAARGAAASPADLAKLAAGEVDVQRCLAIARALMALDRVKWARRPARVQVTPRCELPDDAWLAIRMALVPWPLTDGRQVGTDAAILRRLASGDSAGAVSLALRKLRAAGLTVTLRAAVAPYSSARLWAAALAFPISRKTAAEFVARLDPHSVQETA